MNEKEDRIRWGRVGLIFAAIILVWIWWPTWGAQLALDDLVKVNDSRLDALGKLGDLYGGINALFAALAFGGVAVAAYFQLLTSRAQSKTWNLTKRQFAQQSFEPLFFQLLHLHRECALEVRLLLPRQMEDDDTFDMRQLSEGVNVLREYLATEVMFRLANRTSEERLAEIKALYEEFYTLNESTLGPYFRSLYHIFKLVKLADLDSDQKIRYANIARATLDKDDLLLLSINCLFGEGIDFEPLASEFGLLKHIPDGGIEWLIVQSYYRPTVAMSASKRELYWNEHPEHRPHKWLDER